ncbi:uncharacterized protein isoform X1 [Choristoneura fumiferana]|uniref:uncharacterized protein isoform X1 n=1 Tax=Choristoneura fumiferana TaxID=7141 RepID=UPI003D15789B
MITLQGRNICERHKELNLKVKEAAENKIDLTELKCVDNSDIDRIFKIDLASKYKNVDYVLEELKSGDSLYVSRSLKCEWLYGSDYAHLINPDYLHHRIFPKMSLKMKKKTLSTLSIHLRDETRTQLFYEYCMNTKMLNNALKFLIFTSESFKNELMNDESRFFDLCKQVKTDYMKKFIGNSFTLADTYGERERPLIELSYLYSLNEEKYLNLLEKHTGTNYYRKIVGVKMSRSILKKHKDRVVKKPLLYLNILNKSELVKYSSSEDAIVYAVALLQDDISEFWRCDYFRTNKHILDLIKTPSIFNFVKKIYTEKYNTSQFEMGTNFYKHKYYDLMTFEEREAWALRHLQENLDVIPEDKSYKWYEYVTFAKSFKEIKSQIYIATNVSKRSDMLKVLVKSAKTQRDLEELLNYYYNRHVNERRGKKLDFINTVMEHHTVLEFDDACWGAFDMILRSVDIYNTSEYWGLDDVLTVSLIYHIINNKTLPEDLKTCLRLVDFNNYFEYYLDQLNDERKDLIYNYINQFIISEISEFDSQEYSDDVKDKVRSYLHQSVKLRRVFSKDKYPEIVLKYMQLDLENFGHIVGKSEKPVEKVIITEGYLLRCLKEDASLIVEKLPLIKDEFNNSSIFRINLLLRRIKIYFSNDIAKQCLEFCKKTLYESLPGIAITEYKAIYSIVFAIFQLGDEKTKAEIMDKFAPTNPKIEHDKIGYYVLYTQAAICSFQSYSRPPVPLSKTALYLKGDYVHKCNDMFNMYLVNLPPALRSEFINSLIDAPLALQKRGLRLAFLTFEVNKLKDLVSSVWKKTNNVSLRQILYLLLFNKTAEEQGKTQEILFELLKELTLTLHEDDADEVFECFTDYRVPANLRGPYLEIAWKTVVILPDKKSNFQRKIRVVDSIASNISLMDDKFLVRLIYDHVQKILREEKLRPQLNNGVVELNVALWNLIARYIIDIPNETKQEKSLKLVEAITKECFDHWNEDYNTEDLIFQVFFRNFVDSLITNSSYSNTNFRGVVPIFEYLLESFEKQFGISEMYSYFWDWKLRLMMGKAINGELSSDKEVCINFGSQLGLFIKELKDKKLCYISFFSKIIEKISCCMHDFLDENDPSLDVDDVSILAACGLTQTDIFETYLLALEILPINPTETLKTEYQEVIKKIKEKENAELTAFMKDKFIYSDLKVWKFM